MTDLKEEDDDDDEYEIVIEEGNTKLSIPNSPGKPPDGGWGWFIVLGSFFNNLLCDGISYSFGLITPELMDYFELTSFQTSWLNSILTSFTLMVGPIASGLSNAFGQRAVSLMGSFIASCGLITGFFVKNSILLYFMVAIIGFGCGLIYLPGVVLVGHYFDKKRPLATGIAVCGSGMGVFVFSQLTQILINSYGFHGTFLILGGIMCHGFVFSMLFLPVEEFAIYDSNEEEDDDDIKLETSAFQLGVSTHSLQMAPPGGFMVSSVIDLCNDRNIGLSSKNLHFRSINSIAGFPLDTQGYSSKFSAILKTFFDCSAFKSIPVGLFFLSTFFTGLAFLVPYAHLPARVKILGHSDALKAWLLSVTGIASTLSRLLFGIIVTRFPRSKHYIISGSLLCCGWINLISNWLTGVPTLVIYAIVYGSGTGSYVTLQLVVLADMLDAKTMPSGFAFSLLVLGVSFFTGNPILGAVYDATNDYNIVFWIVGGLFCMAGLLILPNQWLIDRKENALRKIYHAKAPPTKIVIQKNIKPSKILTTIKE